MPRVHDSGLVPFEQQTVLTQVQVNLYEDSFNYEVVYFRYAFQH